MRVIKGTFRVNRSEEHGWVEHEGSYAISFPFYVHRTEKQYGWRLSHMATGRNIISNIRTIQKARELAQKLSKYDVFLMPCIDTWCKALDRMKNNNPQEYDKLLAIVKGDY